MSFWFQAFLGSFGVFWACYLITRSAGIAAENIKLESRRLHSTVKAIDVQKAEKLSVFWGQGALFFLFLSVSFFFSFLISRLVK